MTTHISAHLFEFEITVDASRIDLVIDFDLFELETIACAE